MYLHHTVVNNQLDIPTPAGFTATQVHCNTQHTRARAMLLLFTHTAKSSQQLMCVWSVYSKMHLICIDILSRLHSWLHSLCLINKRLFFHKLSASGLGPVIPTLPHSPSVSPYLLTLSPAPSPRPTHSQSSSHEAMKRHGTRLAITWDLTTSLRARACK